MKILILSLMFVGLARSLNMGPGTGGLGCNYINGTVTEKTCSCTKRPATEDEKKLAEKFKEENKQYIKEYNKFPTCLCAPEVCDNYACGDNTGKNSGNIGGSVSNGDCIYRDGIVIEKKCTCSSRPATDEEKRKVKQHKEDWKQWEKDLKYYIKNGEQGTEPPTPEYLCLCSEEVCKNGNNNCAFQ